jgi:thioredoxin reductase (NADPH)
MLIIGAGPAGLTAAVYGQRAGLRVKVLKGPFGLGQLVQTNELENFPGFVEPLSGFELMDKMEKQAARLGAEILDDTVESVDTSKRPFAVRTSGGVFEAKTVIVATGSHARWLGVEGEKEYRGRGVSACATCDGFFFRGKDVVVVGGGNTAFEDALFLAKICRSVTLVHRRGEFRAAQKSVDIAKADPKIKMKLFCVAEKIEGDVLGVTGITLRNVLDNTVETVPCHGVFVAVGGVPQTDFLKNSGVELLAGGQVKINEKCATNIPGLYAAGDCADPNFRQAVIAAGSGAKAAVEAINHINLN